MSRFITLTSHLGKPLCVNVDHICSVVEDPIRKGETVVSMSSGDEFAVQERIDILLVELKSQPVLW